MRKCVRSLISILLAFAMLMPTALPVMADNSYGFADFPTGWSAPAMAHAVENGIIYGKTGGLIAPNDNLTRAEMAAIINRAFGATVKKDISKFTDVNSSEWYYEDIQKAYNMQTLYGDAENTMRPDAPIIREEAIAIVARAMVLSGYSASYLDKFKDKGEIADWAVDPIASMTANGYVNGDNLSNVSPKANITREEFAQLIYNIIKHYYDDSAKSENYQGNLMLNKPGISLKNITVNGDLILGDGVGTSEITLENIDIKGRLLVRGAAQIKLVNVKTSKGVVVKNVNGTVHFDNYRDEDVFDGVVEHTKVTYKTRSQGSGNVRLIAAFTVEHYKQDLDGTYSSAPVTEVKSGYIGDVVKAQNYQNVFEGFTADLASSPAVSIVSDGSAVLKIYYTRNEYTLTLDFGGATTVTIPTSQTVKYGDTVTLPTTGFFNGTKTFLGWFDAPVGGNRVTEIVMGTGATVYAQWAEYVFTVAHYKQDLDGTYTSAPETELKAGIVGQTVSAADYQKAYEGFTADLANSPDVVVSADNSTVLEIYYTRNEYTLTFDFGGATTVTIPTSQTVKYGQTVTLPTTGFSNGDKPFEGWVDGDGNVITEITMGAAPVTVYAQWGSAPGTTASFVVEHYKENLAGTYELAETTPAQTIAIGTVLTANAYAKTYEGFSVNAALSTDVTVVAGANTLKIYYARNEYTLTFDFGGATTVTIPTSQTVKFGQTVTLPTTGFSYGSRPFEGWKDALGNVVTEITMGAAPVTVYAQWGSASGTTASFVVEHYKENLAGAYELAETTPAQTIAIGTVLTANAYAKTYTGFSVEASLSTDVTVVAGANTLKIYYARNEYTLTYDFGGATTVEIPTSQTVKYGQTVVLPTTGFSYGLRTFDGWYSAVSGGTEITEITMGTSPVTVYARWKDVVFVVMHHKQNLDGSYTSVDTKIESAIAGTTVTADEYKNVYEGFTVDLVNSPDVVVAENNSTVLNIYYTRNEYTLTFDFGGATTVTIPASQTVKFGQTVVLPTTGFSNGAKPFEGWFDENDTPVTQITMGTTPVTVYAKWGDEPVTSATFVVEHYQEKLDGAYELAETTPAQTIAIGAVLTANNYAKSYEGFSVDSALSVNVTVVAGGNTLKIYYTRNEYTLTFDFGGATTVTIPTSQTVKYGQTVTLPTTGFSYGSRPFEGWKDAEGNDVTEITMGTTPVTVYAQWGDEPVTSATFVVEYYHEKLDGAYELAETTPAQTVAIGTVLTAAAYAKTYEGFTIDPVLSVNVTVVAGGNTLKIYYTRNEYTLTYDFGGATTVEIPTSQTVKYGQTVTLPTTGFSYGSRPFAGWKDALGNVVTEITIGAAPVTVYAQWGDEPVTTATFTVEHYQEKLDGTYELKETTPAQTITIGTVLTAAAYAKTYEGFAVEAALSADVTVVAGNNTLKIYYVRNEYTLTYDFGGATTVEIPTSQTVKYGQTVTLPTTGFSYGSRPFEGWKDALGNVVTEITMGTAPVTVYAQWGDEPVTTATFVVEHYQENLDGMYELKETTPAQTVAIGTVLTAAAYAKTYEGFAVEAALSADVTVVAGANTLKIYYARNEYTLTYDFGGATTVEIPTSQTVKYGQTVTLPTTGFSYGSRPFEGWTDGEGNVVTEITMGTAPVTVYAQWGDEPVTTATFTVEHYQEKLDGTYELKETTPAQTIAIGTVLTAAEYAKEYLGFEADATLSTDVTVVAGTNTLKIYYVRKTYTIVYDFAGGTAVGSYETTFKYGQAIPLAQAEKTDEYLYAWFTQPEGAGAQVTNTVNIDHILSGLTGNVLYLYAFWVPSGTPMATFVVEHYKENLDGTYPANATETSSEEDIAVGEILKVSDHAKTYEGFTLDTVNSVDVEVDAIGHYVLKIYYKRNVYTLNYDYSDADTQGIASATFKYGQTITLPEEDTFSKEGFIFTGWYKTEEYKAEDLIDEAVKIEEIVDVNSATEATIYVKWDQFFTVTFKELGILRHTSKVYPGVSNTVPQTDIDTAYGELVNPYIVGYRKDATVSPVYASNPYEHQLFGNWYYYEDGKYILFTDETVINKDLTVRYMFRKAGLELNIPKLSQIIEPTFEVPFESDTRALDTLKDSTFLFEEKLLTAFDALDADQKFNKVNDKLVSLLASKGFQVTPGRIFADDGEILKQHIKFNGFAYFEEAQLKSAVVKAIKTTFRNDPLRMRGVIDEMMQEQDPDVIDLMDDMLVSMLSGSDSARIKDIIAEAVEKAVKDDTTGEFKTKIKDIIIAQLDAGNETVENSVKDAIGDYFMNPSNDDEIKDIVKDLIDQALETDDDNDPIRKFVKGYITGYLNDNHDVLDDMIRELGANLENDSDPVNQHVIELIKEMLMEEGNEAYLEELVDGAVENLHNKVGTDLYNFMIDAITEELISDAAELETLIRAIADSHVEDLTSVLKTVMEDDATFDSIVTSAISDEAIFSKVIKTALNDVVAFEAIVTDLCEDAEFYNLIVDIALSNESLSAKLEEEIVNDDDALIAVLKAMAADPALKSDMIDELLEAGDEELKNQLTNPLDASSEYYADVKAEALAQAEAEIINIIETGINEVDHPDYWPIAFEKAMEVAEANVTQDLIDLGVDPAGSLWAGLYADAMAQATIDVTAELNGGITDASIYYSVAVNGAKAQAETEIEDLLSTGIAEGSKYWTVAYDTAKSILKNEIETNFDSKIDEIKTDDTAKAQIKSWIAVALDDTSSVAKDVLADFVKDLGTSTDADDIALKGDIVETLIENIKTSSQDEKDELVDDIIAELLNPSNSSVKTKVIAKAIEVVNADGNEALKSTLIDSVIADVFADDDLKDDLIDELVIRVQTDDALKQTVVDEAINAVVYDDIVNAEAIEILNNLIETDDVFKADIVTNIIEYILEEDQVRAEAMEKVIIKIESSDEERNEAIDFAFDVLEENTAKRAEIAEKFLVNILSDDARRQNLATDVIDVMFDDATLRNEILDLGFEQMFSSADTIKEIVKLALDELIKDDVVRRDMILAVIETDDGREGILDILFEELERDSTFLDKMVDIAMKGKYGDMVDKFVEELVNEGKIQINPDNRQIAEEIVLPMLDDMTLDTILSKLPAQVTDVLPESLLETIFNKFKSKAREKLVEGIEEAKKGNSKDINVMIDNDIDVINSILVPAYNKAFPKITDKAEDFYYYSENQYIKAMVDMLDPEYILEKVTPGSEMGTGYRVRDSRYYYEMLRNTLVLADDAGQWYLDNISDAQIDKVISKFMSAYTKVITKADSLVGGRIPEDKLNTIISYVEKAIDKRQAAYDSTTNGGFERIDSAYHKIIELVKEKIGADLSTDTVIEVTFDGSELTLNDDKSFNIDKYKINVKVKGYTFKLDSHSIVVGGKTVDISGFVQKVADKFGTRTVTIKFCEEVPYSYELSVGNYSGKVSAFYEG